MRTFQSTVLCFSAAMLYSLAQTYALGVSASLVGLQTTLYQYAQAYERLPDTRLQALAVQLGPIAAEVLLGLAGAAVYARARSVALRRFALYVAAFGAMYVLSAAMACGWSGPLHHAALLLDVPPVFQWSVSVTGVLLLATIMWQTGVRLQPPFEAVVVPVLVSTAARMLVFAPAPLGFLVTIPAGAAPWLVAFAGSWWEWRRAGRTETPRLRLWTAAYLLPLLLMLMAWQLRLGVRFW